MTKIRLLVVLTLCIIESACGTSVPSIRDWPDDDTRAENRMVRAIIKSVGCELSYTITKVIARDKEIAHYRTSHRTYTDFLENWGAEVAINLTVIEKSTVNPTVLLTPPGTPSETFTFAGGLSGSSEAHRLQKINVFYRIKDLYKPLIFPKGVGPEVCHNQTGSKEGSPLVDSDLRLFSLFEGRIGASTLDLANPLEAKSTVKGQENVLTQTISFQIVTSANATPAWKLVRANVNSSGNFFTTSRDRTHELVFTFGPLDPSAKNRASLTPLAEATHQTTQLQTGIRASLFLLQ